MQHPNVLQGSRHETPEESFVINNNEGKFSLSAIGSNEVINVIPAQLLDYVERYKKVYYEMIDIESEQSKLDSIITSAPFITIKVNNLLGISYFIPQHPTSSFCIILIVCMIRMSSTNKFISQRYL